MQTWTPCLSEMWVSVALLHCVVTRYDGVDVSLSLNQLQGSSDFKVLLLQVIDMKCANPPLLKCLSNYSNHETYN